MSALGVASMLICAGVAVVATTWAWYVDRREQRSRDDALAVANRALERRSTVDRSASADERADVVRALARNQEVRNTPPDDLARELEAAEEQERRLDAGKEPES